VPSVGGGRLRHKRHSRSRGKGRGHDGVSVVSGLCQGGCVRAPG
jgi:hypothetical protein